MNSKQNAPFHQSLTGTVGDLHQGDRPGADTFKIRLTHRSALHLTANTQGGGVQLSLWKGKQKVGSSNGNSLTRTLKAGTYQLQVTGIGSGPISYQLQQSSFALDKGMPVDAVTQTPFNPKALLVKLGKGINLKSFVQRLGLKGERLLTTDQGARWVSLHTKDLGHLLEVRQALSHTKGVMETSFDYWRSPTWVPADAGYRLQWGLEQASDADIDASQAWDFGRGSAGVVVAVIDTGVDYNHPDLVNNIWRNSREIAGNRIDDDRNGFVDDVRGWNFLGNNNAPLDTAGHGTHVTGIIAARDNGLGTMGVASQSRIMPLQFMSATGGSTAAATQAIDYAINNGAKVINMSFSSGNLYGPMKDAIARANTKGVTVVCAAGNNGLNLSTNPRYPASIDLPNVITVGASTPTDGLALFSNWGVGAVDIAAPGENIYSTLPGGKYGYMSGTSMATPFVSGVAALLLAQNPNLAPVQLRSIIMSSGDYKPALVGKVTDGKRLNAANSVKLIRR